MAEVLPYVYLWKLVSDFRFVRFRFGSMKTHTFNPSSPNSDQHHFSPNDIHRLSRDEVIRINKMIT